METLKLFIIRKLGKMKHEIDLEAHSRNRLYWHEQRIAGMKRELDDLQQRVSELEEARHDES